MTIDEILTLFSVVDEREKDELELEAHIIRVAVSSAMSGKPLKLFEDTKPKAVKRSAEERLEEFKALDDLGI